MLFGYYLLFFISFSPSLSLSLSLSFRFFFVPLISKQTPFCLEDATLFVSAKNKDTIGVIAHQFVPPRRALVERV